MGPVLRLEMMRIKNSLCSWDDRRVSIRTSNSPTYDSDYDYNHMLNCGKVITLCPSSEAGRNQDNKERVYGGGLSEVSKDEWRLNIGKTELNWEGWWHHTYQEVRIFLAELPTWFLVGWTSPVWVLTIHCLWILTKCSPGQLKCSVSRVTCIWSSRIREMQRLIYTPDTYLPHIFTGFF